MGLDTQANLVVAAMQLGVVRSLRDAIRTADLSSGRMKAATDLGPAPSPEPRAHLTPEPIVEPRRRLHPEAITEPRRTYSASAQIDRRSNVETSTCEPSSEPTRTTHKSPIQPPWAILPWQTPTPPRPVIKVIVHKVDVAHKGSLLDMFI